MGIIKKIGRIYTDKDFGGFNISAGVITAFIAVALLFVFLALTGNLNRCWEETGPHGHLFTVCNDGKYSAYREHSPDCPVIGCPYGEE